MLFKWFAIGAAIGGIIALISGSNFLAGAFIGGLILYSLRKWFLETFWG